METSFAEEALPPLYISWVRAALGGMVPKEMRATCMNCPMCTTDANPVKPFAPEAKCCTYIPEIPNYLCGSILLDEELTDGVRAVFEERVRDDASATPFGIGQPALYALTYEAVRDTCFGKAVALKCPYLIDGGFCGIWAHRNSVCSSWFCRHNRGFVGFQFWQDVRALLRQVESTLATWVCIQLDIPPVAFREYTAALKGGVSTRLATELLGGCPHEARRWWGRWADNRTAFYSRAYRLVRPLSWEDVLQIGGHPIVSRQRVLKESFEALSDERLPKLVRLGHFTGRGTNSGRVALNGYSQNDCIEIDSQAVEVLASARSGAETLGLADRAGLNRGDLRLLIDLRILEPVEFPEDY